MSADSAVTYNSVHSEVPRSPKYVPDPIELEDHVPVYIPEHPEDLLPAEDEAPIEAYIPEVASAPTPPLPSSFLSLRTPPLLPIPLLVPSSSRKAEIPDADTPPQKRLLLTAPRPGYEIGESSAAAAARQPGPTMARSVDCSFVDTMETRFRDTERRMMTALEMVNMRKDRATMRAEIEVLRRDRDLLTSKRKMAPKRTTRSTQVSPVTPAPTATTTTVTEAQLQALIDRGVAAAMAEAEASRVRNGYDSNGLGPRLAQAVRECTYLDFLKCQPLNFKGTEGWSDSLSGVALTWWNSHVKIVTLEVAQALPWKTLKKMMTNKYCPQGEIKKLETEMWELKTKGTDVIGYSRHFQELALMCDRMFPEESDRIEKYIGGLPDMIYDSVKAARPKTMQEAIEFATELMDKRIWGTSGNNQNQPQQNKRQNTGRAYA
nr:hypothetical protein [Tanacetum cinerariifolium]